MLDNAKYRSIVDFTSDDILCWSKRNLCRLGKLQIFLKLTRERHQLSNRFWVETMCIFIVVEILHFYGIFKREFTKRPFKPEQNGLLSNYFLILSAELVDYLMKLINRKYQVLWYTCEKCEAPHCFILWGRTIKTEKMFFFYILTVLWDFLGICSSDTNAEGLKWCREWVSTKWAMLAVLKEVRGSDPVFIRWGDPWL